MLFVPMFSDHVLDSGLSTVREDESAGFSASTGSLEKGLTACACHFHSLDSERGALDLRGHPKTPNPGICSTLRTSQDLKPDSFPFRSY